ncbi:MAG TPA: zinc ribbon domain-containing protein [Blastocatellia bacterium]|nr:zinc ribbon domain-containing protein [Blastocatellia bacterium]
MDLNPNHARARVESGPLYPAAADEINLYDELLTFSEMPPEERGIKATEIPEPQPVDQTDRLERGSIPTQPLTQDRSRTEPQQTQPLIHDHAEVPTSYAAPAESEPEIQPKTEFGDSGPFGALDSEFQYNGSLSGGTCLGCGAESGAEDLFCITCGAFVDDADSLPASKPVCAECGLDSSADEIFCPECGSLVA